VALFHVLGVHQAVQFWKATSSLSTAATSSQSLLVPLLKYPSMMMVLISLLLVTSTSMITNDYYDARNGVDTVEPTTNIHDSDTDSNNYEHYHPLAAGLLPFTITKTFDSYLYAILLLSSAFVPGVVSRLLVIGGAIITYLYTVHLKPKTWIKNLSCAALVAMSPVTSGLAAWHVLCGGAFLQSQGIGGVGGTLVTTGSSRLIFKSPLIFLVVSLFAGIMSREIMMDITDCESDAKARIVTIPVKYGKKFASKVALGWTLVSAFGACWLPLTSLIPSCSVDSVPVTTFFGASYSALISSLTSFATNSDARSLLLSVVGSVLLVQRAFAVWKTSGDDVNLAERAVREGFLSVVLVLASFV
jgi:4-hydroxybenzoate polyprenyltransferase